MYKETRESSYRIVLLQQAAILKNGPSKSSVYVLSLTVFYFYTRLQIKYDFSKLDDSGNSIEIWSLFSTCSSFFKRNNIETVVHSQFAKLRLSLCKILDNASLVGQKCISFILLGFNDNKMLL